MKDTSATKPAIRQPAIIPPVLIKSLGGKQLSMFRTKEDGKEFYHLEVDAHNVIYTFTHWQFHIFNALFAYGGESYDSLLDNVNERFGLSLQQSDVESFFEKMANKHLFDAHNAPKHPLTMKFCQKGGASFSGDGNKKLDQNSTDENASVSSKGQTNLSFTQKIKRFIKKSAKALVFESTGLEDDASDEKQKYSDVKITHSFNPTPFIQKHRKAITSLKSFLYPLPLFAFFAVFTLLGYAPEAKEEIFHPSGLVGVTFHMIFGLFTVNLLCAMATASVAHSYTATVKSLSVVWVMGFIPRFFTQLDDTQKLPRNHKLWLIATPLLVRLGLFGVGTFIWYQNRSFGGFIPQFGATLSLVSGFSFMLTVCPLIKNSGYYFLAVFLDEPNLRDKAKKALLNKIYKNQYVKANSNVLAAYAVACVAFTLTLALAFVMIVYKSTNTEMGITGIVVSLLLVSVISYKLLKKLSQVNAEYHKNLQFDRWRERTLPTEFDAKQEEENLKSSNLKRGLMISAALLLLFPYPYKPSGKVLLMPSSQQQVSTDIAGIVGEVFFDGGEFIRKGELIARLSVSDYEDQIKINEAKLSEQQSLVDHLISLPAKEDLDIYTEKLVAANVQWAYSNEKCERQNKLFKSGAISLEAMAEVERVCEIDKQRVVEAEAELAKIARGAPEEEIAVAKAALGPIQAEIEMYKNKVKRSEFIMPFDGYLKTLYLRERQGKFLERGEPLALVEDSASYKAIMEVPQTDMPYVKIGSEVELRTLVYPDKTFKGTVRAIEPDVEGKTKGRMLRMTVSLDKQGKVLKSGMTGYAKVQGDSIVVWKLLTRAIYRFVNVELWAWAS